MLGLHYSISLVAVHRLSCSMACGSWVPWWGIIPRSPALEGRLLTTGPPGKSHSGSFDASINKPHKDLKSLQHEDHKKLYLSVQFSCSVVSDSLRPRGLQHARLPCPSPTPRTYSHSCLQSQWCHPTISSSVIPFSSCLQSSPAPGSFQMSQFFTSGGQSIGVSAWVLPKKSQGWSPSEWTGWISLQSEGLSRVFSNTTVQKHQLFELLELRHSAFFIVQLSHPYMTTGKTIALTRWTFIGKVMSLFFNMLSRLVITFCQGTSVF